VLVVVADSISGLPGPFSNPSPPVALMSQSYEPTDLSSQLNAQRGIRRLASTQNINKGLGDTAHDDALHLLHSER
jgi:hypothetical protein